MTTKWLEKISRNSKKAGKLGWAMLVLLGVPLPVLFIFYLIRGCN